MLRKPHIAFLSVTACFLLIALAIPAALAASPQYPTTAVAQLGIKQATIGGNHGVLVNYTSSITSPYSFVYLDLTNSAGQTVYLTVGTVSFQATLKVPCFLTISSAVPSGSYTAKVFATTTGGIPISTTGTLKVTV